MALIGVLIATLIILLLIVFYNPFFAKTENNTPLEPNVIQNNATDAVDKSTDNKRLESEMIKNIDLP